MTLSLKLYGHRAGERLNPEENANEEKMKKLQTVYNLIINMTSIISYVVNYTLIGECTNDRRQVTKATYLSLMAAAENVQKTKGRD